MNARFRVVLLALLAAGIAVLPAAGGRAQSTALNSTFAQHVSQSVVVRYSATHPGQAPEGFRQGVESLKRSAAAPSTAGCNPHGDRFNCDTTGLPQNEESITACRSNTNYVLGGTNDYRGILDPEGNFTGWDWSIDGGNKVNNEGLLPPVTHSTGEIPSGGDPVFIADDACHLFAGSLAYNGDLTANGIAVYRTEPSILNSCPGGSDPSCWPTKRLIAEGAAGHFLDKEWIYVGMSGGVEYVWVTWSDFDETVSPDAFHASVKAARCNATLTSCTGPIDISTVDDDIQFSDVTIGQDGRTYVTWSRIDGELEGTAQTFTHKLRIAPAGSVVFGPETIVHVEDNAIPFGGTLQANDFRIATYPKNEVAMVNGHPRIFVVWDACLVRPLPSVCEKPLIKLKYSDNDGASWSPVIVLSEGGVNYFPSISTDRSSAGHPELAVAWFTNIFDRAFENQQDVVLASIDARNPRASHPKRLTHGSNESEADPLLTGFFIGDYIEVFTHGSHTWTHYNANYEKMPLVFGGVPVNQQDNYLSLEH